MIVLAGSNQVTMDGLCPDVLWLTSENEEKKKENKCSSSMLVPVMKAIVRDAFGYPVRKSAQHEMAHHYSKCNTTI